VIQEINLLITKSPDFNKEYHIGV